MIKNYNSYIKENVQFTKNGELSINNSLKFDIEIANTPQQIQRGLMYRKQMDENKGMLFIFEYEDFWKFWMKNTYIPLDIIYINKDKEIVDIKKNTTPLSLKSLTPYEKSLYVLEINGGMCDKYKIKIGNKINFYG